MHPGLHTHRPRNFAACNDAMIARCCSSATEAWPGRTCVSPGLQAPCHSACQPCRCKGRHRGLSTRAHGQRARVNGRLSPVCCPAGTHVYNSVELPSTSTSTPPQAHEHMHTEKQTQSTPCAVQLRPRRPPPSNGTSQQHVIHHQTHRQCLRG
jgi:hypothetical protein